MLWTTECKQSRSFRWNGQIFWKTQVDEAASRRNRKLIKPTINKEIELVTTATTTTKSKKLSTKKNSEPDGFTGKFYQAFAE